MEATEAIGRPSSLSGPGPARSRILAQGHRPEVCLPAAGYKLRADRGTITIKAKGLIIPFHAVDFDYNGSQTHVFYCLWQDSPKPRNGLESGTIGPASRDSSRWFSVNAISVNRPWRS